MLNSCLIDAGVNLNYFAVLLMVDTCDKCKIWVLVKSGIVEVRDAGVLTGKKRERK